MHYVRFVIAEILCHSLCVEDIQYSSNVAPCITVVNLIYPELDVIFAIRAADLRVWSRCGTATAFAIEGSR